MSRPSSAPLSQSVVVETPELVTLSYTIAGVGSRAYAALIDALICLLLLLAVLIGGGTLGGFSDSAGERSAAWTLAVLGVAQFAILWGYYVLFEAFFDGQTPGKRSQRLRVVQEGGYSITFGASAVRNLVRVVDMQPVVLYAVGMVGALLSPRGKRLGDLAAGTLVVREEIVRAPVPMGGPMGSATGPEDARLDVALSEAEFAVLARFAARYSEIDAPRRADLAARVAERLGLDPTEGGTPTARLMRLYEAERAARAQGAAARHDTGAARERHAIVAAGSPRWSAFADQLARAQKRGLSHLGEEGVRRFVREYREIASDLARLRTATQGVESDEIFYLNRLASGAHNLLYRRRPLSPGEIADFVLVTIPREIRASALPILLAAALLFVPAGVAYVGVLRQPSVAETLLPPEMLDRAEGGVRRAEEGTGYIEDPQIFRPVMASRIVTNNVQVAFAAFAFGISAGLLTAWVLLTNGISFGAVFGLYASKGIGALLLAFVAPHAVLELAAICISAGGGFLLAAGLLLPGDRTRRAALVENGGRAVRLVAGAALLLVVAGSIEGFVSPIPYWPLELKLVVSGLTAVALYLYLRLAPAPVRSSPST